MAQARVGQLIYTKCISVLCKYLRRLLALLKCYINVNSALGYMISLLPYYKKNKPKYILITTMNFPTEDTSVII